MVTRQNLLRRWIPSLNSNHTINRLYPEQGAVTSIPSMASARAKITFRILLAVLVFFFLFYLGRPLYWKILATIDEIRQNKQTVQLAILQIMYEAQKRVWWFHDEADSGLQHNHSTRKLLSEVL